MIWVVAMLMQVPLEVSRCPDGQVLDPAPDTIPLDVTGLADGYCWTYRLSFTNAAYLTERGELCNLDTNSHSCLKNDAAYPLPSPDVAVTLHWSFKAIEVRDVQEPRSVDFQGRPIL